MNNQNYFKLNQVSDEIKEITQKRLAAQPLLLKESLFKRALWTPTVFFRQWMIGREFFSEWRAFKYTFDWTFIILYPSVYHYLAKK